MTSKSIRAEWEHCLLVCRKCSKKQKGGFGLKGKTKLAKHLRFLLSAKKGRKSKVGVVEVGCLDICPKHAVVMIDSRRPKDWILIKPGADDAELLKLANCPN